MTPAIDVGSLFATALSAHLRGDLDTAQARYQETLAIVPGHAKANANLGTLYLGQQRLGDAIACYRRALEAEPNMDGVRAPLGMALSVEGQHREACGHLEYALGLDPNDADVNFHLGESYLALDRFAEALACYQRALAIAPEHADAARALGLALWRTGQRTQALHWLREARRLRPDDIETTFRLATALFEIEHDDEALALFRELARSNDDPAILNNLAMAQVRTGDTAGAIAMLRAALERHPDYALGWNTLGSIRFNAGMVEEARAAFEKVVALAPDEPDGYVNLANCHAHRRDARQAFDYACRALERCPPDPAKLWAVAQPLERLGQYELALRIYRRLLEIDPANRPAAARLLHLTLANCDWTDYQGLVDRTLQRVRQDMAAGRQLTYVIFNLLALPVTHRFVFDAARHQSARIAADARAQMPNAAPFAHRPRGRKRIRIGYALPYTFFHSMPLVLKEIVRDHDRDRFEVFGYSVTRSDGTAFNAEFRETFDRFRDIAGANTQTGARAIHEDEIDILVDTTGQTPITCLPLMSLRPAPVQVHAIGFGLSTGADYIDYLISDRTFMPPDCRARCSERLVYMPDCFLPAFVQPAAEEAATRAGQDLPDDAVVFMNFNEAVKFEPRMFDVWMRILAAVPNGVLWLGNWHGPVVANLRREAEARGVSGDRLVFAKIVPHKEHARRLALADLALDNLYHGGGITSIDALSAGVPLLTVRGDTPQSRLGATLSQAAGVPDLVVESLEAYERTAIALAGDPRRRQALSARLLANRATAPLFDVDRYRRHLESAYRTMWDIHQRGEPPRGFDVTP